MRKLLHTFIILFFSVLFCQAQEAPKLGLTLSGGGAKGLAHIGVLQVLEENGIVPDYITGTSMGSIVGGLYSIGYTPRELEELATSINWDDYFNDTYPRNYRPIEERERADRYLLSFALENGKIVIPKGLIAGKKIQTLLGGITAPVHNQLDFNRFYRPFACVATDLETGAAYVFREGPLRKAIRASMSIPTAFNPILYDDHLLADGLLVRNLPVSDVLAMGADQVIAVDVGDPLYPREELNSVLRVLEQTSSFGMATSTKKERALAHQLIDPDLSGYTTLSYNEADSLIARGRAAAEQMLPELLHWADSVGIIRRAAPQRPPWRRDSFLIKELIIEAKDQPAELVLQQLMTIELPKLYTISDLTRWVDLLYATGFFELVDYELHLAEGGGYLLYLTGESSLNTQLRAGINYDSDINASFLVNFTARNWLLNGSVFTADARVSEFPAVLLDYAVYTRYNPSIGIQLRAVGQFLPGREHVNNKLEDEFTFHHYETSLDLQTSISRQWFFKLGLGAEHFSKNPRFISFTRGEAILRQWFTYGRFIRDTYDRTYFPSEGSLTRAWIRYSLGGSLREFGDEEIDTGVGGNVMAGLSLHKVFPLSRRLWLDWNVNLGGSAYQRAHLLQQFYLGRQMPHSDRFAEFYGLYLTEQPATVFAFSRIQLRAEVGRNNFIGLGYNLGYHYLTAGNLLDEEEGLNNPLAEGRLHGVGLELGSLTPIGPVRFTTEYNIDLDRLNFSFFAGYRF